MMEMYDVTEIRDFLSGDLIITVKTPDGRIYRYVNRESMFDILTCELHEVLVPTANHELMNQYVNKGYVITEIGELVTKMKSKRAVLSERNNNETHKHSTKNQSG